MVETRRSKRIINRSPSSSPTVSSDDDDFQPVVGTTRKITRSQKNKNNKKVKTKHSVDVKSVKEANDNVPSSSHSEQASSASPQSNYSEENKKAVRKVEKVLLKKVKQEDDQKIKEEEDSQTDEEDGGFNHSPSNVDVNASPSPSSTSDSDFDEDENEEEAAVASSPEDEDNDNEDGSDNEAALGTRRRGGGGGGGGGRRRRGNGNRTTTTRRRFAHHYERTRFKVHEHHKELEHVWTDLEKTKKVECEPIEQPSFLNLSLLPFQKAGVAWMIKQEQNPDFRGGILADEMGMGKTIQTISLLLSDGEGPSLVIVPTVALVQWKREIETHTNTDVKVHIYHGAKRTKKASELIGFDIILTTYSIMEGSFRRQEYGAKRKDRLVKEKSPLHQISWHRIVLDEAHNIKDRSCNTARSVFNLTANYKWSLTGTPLQNRVGELYSLIRFMQADPYAYYYCTQCDCKSINWKFTNKKGCDDCGHTPMHHVCWWNNEVLKPIQVHGYVNAGKEALEKLRLLLDRIMLRRTKIQCADDLGLPPKSVVIRRDIFTDEEEDVYRSLYSNVARKFTTYVEEGTVLNNYANIFELLMRMRQCADHPDLITKKATDNKQLVCVLCNEPPEDPIAASCKHIFCRECCTQYYNSFDDTLGEKIKCPSCFAQLSVDLYQTAIEIEQSEGGNSNYSKSSIVNRINMNTWRSSTKIEALYEELSKLRREDKTIKSIVFSQFVNFLDLCNWRLSRAGFECVRLDGTMSPAQRDDAINYFMTKPTATIFLISLKAGGVALNLTEASRVFILDPWWNPAAELQAMDRIHRLGQHRPIRVTRLIIENSIESRIVQLQEKKAALVDSTVGHNSQALDKLSVEDLRFLFVM